MKRYRWIVKTAGQAMHKEPIETAAPAAGEVLVEVAGCGVCHTDIDYFFNGVRTSHPLPLTLGHEISGRVVAAGAGAEDWLGKAVVIPAVVPCGECDLCRRGKGTICRSQRMPGNHIDGGFATHIAVPARDSAKSTRRNSPPPVSSWRTWRSWPTPSRRPIRRRCAPASGPAIW